MELSRGLKRNGRLYYSCRPVLWVVLLLPRRPAPLPRQPVLLQVVRDRTEADAELLRDGLPGHGLPHLGELRGRDGHLAAPTSTVCRGACRAAWHATAW